MSKRKDITPILPDAPDGTAEAFDGGFRTAVENAEIGQWYWVKSKTTYDGQRTTTDFDSDGKRTVVTHKKGKTFEWLGCIMEIGSNYVELQAPHSSDGYSSTRVHFDEFESVLRYEPDADQIIHNRTQHYQRLVGALLGEVNEITQRLGVVPTKEIADNTGSDSNALAVISTQVDTEAHKNALVKAQKEDLPALFKEIESANKELARWMAAPTMPFRATIGPMKQSIDQIKERVYTISLYAGLTEVAVKCCDGDPAAMSEKLHIMQRRLYMDEECLLDYQAGGMEMKDIEEFDAWISKPENRDRILPFPRTMAGFQVRRDSKDREDGGNFLNLWVNIQLRESDKYTYFYIRNGEQVWRIVADFDFDELIFPNQQVFDPSKPMMVEMFAHRVKNMITHSDWEVRKAEYDEKKRLADEWDAANPDVKNNSFHNPHNYYGSFRPSDWVPFDATNVYYDEAMKEMQAVIKKYNRIAVIVQGLFDRSLVLHPHRPVRVWDAASFDQSIELIYDAMTLTYGDKPDFEAFRAKLNASLGPDSVVTGQEDFWLRLEADRENERQKNDWRNRDRQRSNYTRYKPYGNPGPGLVAKMTEWKARARKAVFRWDRSTSWRTEYYGSGNTTKAATVTVPASALLNVSAYTPGDYRQFFEDPRTRQEYLKWAPLLLAAEDYHAGKEPLGKGRGENSWR